MAVKRIRNHGKWVWLTRVANRCSNPECRAVTGGPQTDPGKAVNLGVAASR